MILQKAAIFVNKTDRQRAAQDGTSTLKTLIIHREIFAVGQDLLSKQNKGFLWESKKSFENYFDVIQDL